MVPKNLKKKKTGGSWIKEKKKKERKALYSIVVNEAKKNPKDLQNVFFISCFQSTIIKHRSERFPTPVPCP